MAAPIAGLSEETARQLYIMERDTKHINALLRACKADLVVAPDGGQLRPAITVPS
ncbi:MAG: hypothetical protein IT162_01935 [Bryobacterales bacterium]|nr:hypothetical protein [Bryobacterales bacterium]